MVYTDLSGKAGQLNDVTEVSGNFDLMFGRLHDSDSTGGSTSATTFTQVGNTLSVAPGDIKDHIIVIAQFFGSYNAARNSFDMYIPNGSYDIRIGETGLEASKESGIFGGWTGMFRDIQAETSVLSDRFTLIHVYLPTSSEKTNGFNVMLYGKITTGGYGSGTVTLGNAYIFGQ